LTQHVATVFNLLRCRKQTALIAAAALSLQIVLLGGCNGGGSSAPPVTPTAPAITTQPVSQSIIIGSTASFSVVASGSSPLSYQWQLNGSNISGAANIGYTTPVLTGNDNGDQFTVIVSNSAGNVTSSAAKLTVSAAPPVITTQPASNSVQIGAPATFSVVATGTAPLSYQWSRAGTAIQGATQASYTLANPQLSDNGATFTAVVSNSAGSVTSGAATLTVTPVPVTITSQPSGGTFFSGESTTLSVVAAGTAPSYQWLKNGTAIGNATVASYTAPTFTTVNDKDSYTVTISNAAGSVTSSAAVIRIGPFATVYTTQQGNTLNLYAWPGQKMAILTASNATDPSVMRKYLTAADGTWNYYADATGSLPGLAFNYNGLATIAEVQSACGAGCTYIGATGMEIEDPYFQWMPDGIPYNVYDQVMFYEMGRSFWLFESRIGYRSPGNSASLQTGYAILMRFRSIAALGYQGAFNGFYSTPVTTQQIQSATNNYNTLLANNAGLIDAYAANTSLTWNNTFYTNTFSNPNGSCADLFASLIQRLAQNYGGEAFIQDLWKEVLKRPVSASDQDALDNFVLAASAAANKNLTGIFLNQWRWPVSSAAQQAAQSTWGAPVL